MKTVNAIYTLRDLAEQDLERAAVLLGDMRRGQQAANEQLSMLLDYQDEYRNKLNSDMSSGIASNRWTNYHQFIQTLEKAIEQHRSQLQQWNQRLEQALVNWREKQQRLNAYQTLITRAEENALRQENRLDQKRMDEFAQRAALRKGE
ncbi:flagellar export protein FliJ [Pantoea stewartii]|uniref:Flagellar FliJ protein n=1 Tax=Pantoea stewartii subsp. stewartii DC283 TaxID=660596 RepID=H3RDI6_PANSE|nr:flagellar export protein FliJ [Pantoea stewartii]ARF49983.1 flagellar biosynthesis chaperone FliJ [Pantoea stewartii subsp. stewartii DC283]EHU00537.1 flagellar protein [Pantoea stewartii subsp. stewartii DC283]KAB0554743.1 flagella biosynthesis chaperone FliJ [Pantoea stewartii subsp. stewartii]